MRSNSQVGVVCFWRHTFWLVLKGDQTDTAHLCEGTYVLSGNLDPQIPSNGGIMFLLGEEKGRLKKKNQTREKCDSDMRTSPVGEQYSANSMIEILAREPAATEEI